VTVAPTEGSTLGTWCPESVDKISASSRRVFSFWALLTMHFHLDIWFQQNVRVFDGGVLPAHSLLELINNQWMSWVACRSGTVREVD
jgi:hypothetical protein